MKATRKKVLVLAVASALSSIGGGFFASTALAGGAALSWTASVSAPENLTGYNVYFGTVPGGPYPTKIGAIGKVTSYTVPNLTAGSRYCFVVTAYGPGGESGNSNEACATIPFVKPVPATGLNANGIE